jgi:hypothetical protein
MGVLDWVLKEIEAENARAEKYSLRLRQALIELSNYLKALNIPMRFRDPVPFFRDKVGFRSLTYYLVLDYTGLHFAIDDGDEERFYNFHDMPRERVVSLYKSGRIVEFLRHVAEQLKALATEEEKHLSTAERILKVVSSLSAPEAEGG